MTMGAGKLRVSAVRGGVVVLAAAAAAALAAGCGSAAVTPPGAGQAALLAAPASVPELGPLRLGSFPATWDGTKARAICQQWAGLRGEYVTRLHQDTPFQLEVWISTSPQWLAAFTADSPLKTDSNYSAIRTSFGVVSTAAAASIGNAKWLDTSCAAAD
jgi:hypothetical protein